MKDFRVRLTTHNGRILHGLEHLIKCFYSIKIAIIKFLKFRNLSPPNNLLIKDLFVGFLQGLGPLKASLNLSWLKAQINDL